MSIVFVSRSYAIPIPSTQSAPVVDTQKQTNDIQAYAWYAVQLSQFIHQLSTTSSVSQQLASLNSLLATQDQMQHICNDYCTNAERQQLTHYLNDVDTTILARFNDYTHSLYTHVTTLNELNTLLASALEGGNTENIGLSLQQASHVTLTQISDTLQQIQSTLVLTNHKEQMEHKLEQANADAVYRGFANSGL